MQEAIVLLSCSEHDIFIALFMSCICSYKNVIDDIEIEQITNNYKVVFCWFPVNCSVEHLMREALWRIGKTMMLKMIGKL